MWRDTNRYANIGVITLLLLGLNIAPSANGAVTCRSALFSTQIPSAFDLSEANSKQFQQTLDKMKQLQELSKTESVDFEITELLAEPVFSLQSRFSEIFKNYSDIIEEVVPGLKGRPSIDLAIQLTKDLEKLSKLSGKQRDFLTALKGLIPGLIEKQTRRVESNIRIQHKEALSLITEFRSDNESLKTLGRELKALSTEIEFQVETQQNLKEYFQKMSWDIEKGTARTSQLTDQLQAVKYAAIQTENHIKALKQTLGVIGALQLKVDSTIKNNLIAFNKLSSLVKKDLPQMQVMLAQKGLDLSPQADAKGSPGDEKALEQALKTGLKDQTIYQKFDEFQKKVSGFSRDVYTKYLNEEIDRWGPLKPDEILYILMNMHWFDFDEQKGKLATVYNAFPLTPLPFFLKEQPGFVEFLILPLVFAGRLAFGKRTFLSSSQLIVLKLLKKLDYKNTNQEEFLRLQSYLSNGSQMLAAVYDYDKGEYLTTLFFKNVVTPYLQKKQAEVWLQK